MELSVSGHAEVTLKWSTKHSPAYYELYRAEKNGKYKKIAKISGKKRTFTDIDVSPKTVYSYKIRGVVENRETKTKKPLFRPGDGENHQDPEAAESLRQPAKPTLIMMR